VLEFYDPLDFDIGGEDVAHASGGLLCDGCRR